MYIRRNNLQQSKNHALEQHLVIQDNAYFDLLSEKRCYRVVLQLDVVNWKKLLIYV